MDHKELESIRVNLRDPVFFTAKTGTIKGKPFGFKHRDHLHMVYRDPHPRVVIVAGRQTEKSETVARRAIYEGYTRAYTTITYTAPRQEQVTRFQSERFRGAITDSQKGILENSIDKGRDAKTATKLTNRSMYYFGSGWADGDALRGIPADIVFFDEVQDMTQTAIESIEKSVSHSEMQDPVTELNGKCIYTGTPKQKGSYYDRVLWGMSDQKKWEIECSSCKTKQFMSMHNIMDHPEKEDHKYFGCTNCAAPLDRHNGHWQPTKPENKLYSGYLFTQLNMPWISANQIWRDYQTMDEMTFYNEVLGEFYAGNAKPITIDDVLACTDKGRQLKTACEYDTVLAVDWGSGQQGNSKTIIIIGHEEVVEGDTKLVIDYAENCKITDHEELVAHVQRLKNRFSSQKVNVDIGYGSYEHGKFFQWWGTAAMATRYVSYSGNPAKRELKEKNILHVDRTYSMDKLVDMFKKRQIVIPYKNPGEIEFLFDHFTAIEMEYTESKTSSGRKLYTHKTPDDGFHALNYLREGIAQSKMRLEWAGNKRDTELDGLFDDRLPDPF
ncbi:hypothetical protein EG878_14760 [Enterococcus faecalis]|nr:hypothetical protein EG878_14760 [Enterococcus faecalis]